MMLLYYGFISCAFLIAAMEAYTYTFNDDFLKWFLRNGGYAQDLEIFETESMGRGVRAKVDIKESQKIIEIPKKIIISQSLVANSDDNVHKKISQAFTSEEEVIVAFILLEWTKNDFWAPYFNVLPEFIPNLSFFDKETLMELEDEELIHQAIEMKSKLAESYQTFLVKSNAFWPPSLKSSLETITLQKYLWAHAVLDSRALRFQGKVHLAPLADMFNYQVLILDKL